MILYIKLAWEFFLIGAISFGGGFAMLPLLERALVNKWISEQQFLDILAISQATPGAFAINLATYVGAIALPYAILGSLITTTTLSLPGFLLSYFVAYPLYRAKENPFIAILMKHLAPATLGLIGYAGVNLFLSELFTQNPTHPIHLTTALVMLLSAIILKFKLIKSVYLIFLMAFLGAILTFL
ncbi:chromate transporter [Entomospira culicis]|uniref:Chromate transporter n=1 Tax=Entomospira culicis TaxID=2719989 RepID=A0A968KUJ4_9SPIO|nr:chromate transporter [Entomospira culicis]NIZ18970.1 chromate transporter [Entomospira culicis]NIZ69185.1 chromate transporter [Entomospira culicis]WDI37771.1 chromate transporter [Entomospira culicis]WDI39399.1 chromate transporter [Entomospira culicis]